MALLLAATLLLQEKSAEDIFRKIEETLTGAKTLSVKFKVSGSSQAEGAGEKMVVEGTFLLKGEKQIYLSFAPPDKAEERILVVSDGDVLQSHSKVPGSPVSFPAQPRQRHLLEYSFVRGGAAGLMSMGAIFCGLVHNARKMEPDPKKLVAVTDLQLGPKEGGASLTFTSKMDHFGPTLQITLWYDPATHQPLKSTVVFVGKGRSLTEVYEDLVLNAAIPDEKFKLPEERK